MDTNRRNVFCMILLAGSLWGIAEATLGYLLHLLPVGLAGYLMFPVGFFFMFFCVKATGLNSSAFLAGTVAASIKLVNFSFPGVPAILVINPAIAILLESAFVTVMFRLLKGKRDEAGLPALLFANTGWRAFFLLNQYLLLVFFGITANHFSKGIGAVLVFILVENIISTALIFCGLKIRLPDFAPKRASWQVKPVFSVAFLVIALLVTAVFSAIK